MRKEVISPPPTASRWQPIAVLFALSACLMVAFGSAVNFARRLGEQDAGTEMRIKLQKLERDIGIEDDRSESLFQHCRCDQRDPEDPAISRWMRRAVRTR